jgi:hypothetical protein
MSRRSIRKLVALSPATAAEIDRLRHSAAVLRDLHCTHCGAAPRLYRDDLPSESQVMRLLIEAALDRRSPR